MITYWDRGLEWMGEGLQLAICPSFTGPTSLAALDVSGNANHGTLTNMDRNAAWVASGGYGALSFDGTNDYIDLGLSQNLRPPAFTYSAWINPSATQSAYAQILGFDVGSSQIQVCTLLIKSNLKLAFYVARPGAGTFDLYDGTGATLTGGVWYHVLAQHSPAGLRVFLNNVLDGLAAYTAAPNVAAGSFWIGGQNNYNNRFFSGQIDDARIYNRVLTASEIRQMYDLGRGGGMLYQPPKRRSVFIAAGFKAYWHRRQSQLIGGGV